MFTRPLKRSQDWAELVWATEGEDAASAMSMPEAFNFASRGVRVPAGQNGGRRDRGGDGEGESEDSNGEPYGDSRLKGRVGLDALEQLRGSADLVHTGRFVTDPRPNRRSVSVLQSRRSTRSRSPACTSR